MDFSSKNISGIYSGGKSMVGRRKSFLKLRPLKVGFIMVNFWKKLPEKAIFDGKNDWNSLVRAKIMDQSKLGANYQVWTVQLINIIWKIKCCSEKKFLTKIIGGHVLPPPDPTVLIIQHFLIQLRSSFINF